MTEDQWLESAFARYEAPIAGLGRAVRLRVQARLPSFNQILYYYENRGNLVISWSPTENGYDGVCSLAVAAGGVLLHFAKGAALLGADPGKRLQGRGPGVRHVVLTDAAEIADPSIEALFSAALALAGVQVDPGAAGKVLLAPQQRARKR